MEIHAHIPGRFVVHQRRIHRRRRAAVVTAGNWSISTKIASAASLASLLVFATTIAIGSPTYRTRPVASARCGGRGAGDPSRCFPAAAGIFLIPTASRSAP
jgi:hypothetical protein